MEFHSLAQLLGVEYGSRDLAFKGRCRYICRECISGYRLLMQVRKLSRQIVLHVLPCDALLLLLETVEIIKYWRYCTFTSISIALLVALLSSLQMILLAT